MEFPHLGNKSMNGGTGHHKFIKLLHSDTRKNQQSEEEPYRGSRNLLYILLTVDWYQENIPNFNNQITRK